MDIVGKYTLEVMSLANWYNEWLFETIGDELSGDILEVGFGIGNFSKLLAKKGKLWGIDINKGYIDKFKDKKVINQKMGYGDIEKEKYFFRDKRFNNIVCFNVIEHIKNERNALKNLYSLLKPQGKVFILVPAHDFLFSNFDSLLGHFRRYNKNDFLQSLERVGFKKIRIRYFNWWAAIGWFFYFKILKYTKMPKRQVGIFNFLGKAFLLPEKCISPPFGLSVLAICER